MPEPQVQVDFIGPDDAQGPVASMFMAGGKLDVGRMRPFVDGKTGKPCVAIYKGGDRKDLKSYQVLPTTNATLRREEWKQLDEAIIPIAESRLTGVDDLVSRGLTYNLGNAMGTTVLEWHDIGGVMEAELTMDGITRTRGDRPVYGHHYLPIPIIHVDYEINARELEASRKLGNPLDTTNAESAARAVMKKLEEMFFTNTTYGFGGGTIYSFLNHPDRNIHSLGTAWTSDSGANILDDLIKMKQAELDAHRYGPWVGYVPAPYETVFDEDYTSGYPKTIRQRLMEVGGITDIKVIDTLTAGNVLLIQMQSDVVRLVRGMGLQNVQWSEEGGMVTKFKVMTIQVPQIRADQNGSSGIVHAY